jgi:hypothetical protein
VDLISSDTVCAVVGAINHPPLGGLVVGPLLALLLCAFVPTVSAKQVAPAGTQVEGIVFVRDSSGNRSSVSGAIVKLTGPVVLDGVTDENGKFAITNVVPGTYTLQATFPGLKAVVNVRVETTALNVSLELKPVEVTSSILVTPDQTTPNPTASETVSAKTLRDAPNSNERFENALPLVPGVVRGPDGHVNLKGTRGTQSGSLVNSANVSDPVTGSPAINLPIDVVESVEVVSNPFDPQYGKFTGALSTVSTKTGNYQKYRFSLQNFVPRIRDRDGIIAGIGAATPRLTFTGPIVKDRISITQSFEYRYVRTPVNSLPPLQRDTKLESFDSYTQLDFIINKKQTATVSVAIYPQKLDYFGLNTFTPLGSTSDFHQRGYQFYAQHRYVTERGSFLTSQLSYKSFDADITAQNNESYRLELETTEGGYFNRQARRTWRLEWQENYQLATWHFFGAHQWKVGINYAHSSYDGRQTFLPVEIDGPSAQAVEHITFTPPTAFAIDQNETAWYVADQWSLIPRLTLNLGARFDNDSVTDSTHFSPRAGFLLALTRDGRTILKGGVGIFYDRVPLMVPSFEDLPDRTVTRLDSVGNILNSTSYVNRLTSALHNPRSTSWDLELDRQLFTRLSLRVRYEQRNTAKDFVVSPTGEGANGILSLANAGSDSYREFQVTGRYQSARHTLNASYVRSRAFGDLNDLNEFFGSQAQPVIQQNGRGRLAFDAPNRFLFWGSFSAPGKVTVVPVFDIHTGFPYSVEDQFRDYVGPRNVNRFPRFSSFDLQIARRVALPIREHHLHARVGLGVFNLFNHFNPRDVQNNLSSFQFGGLYNSAWREFRGKFVLEF